MPSILDTIIAAKKEEVRRLRRERRQFSGRTGDRRPFVKVLRREGGPAVIAEIKKASPSKGIIAREFDPAAIAKKYHAAGAAALSVLTDEKFFMGSRACLETARNAAPLPVLRKDFIIDPVQVEETAVMGADAMLLIAAVLSRSQMDELYCAGREAGLDILVEVRTPKELNGALALSPLPACIGVNNRDLATFETNIAATLAIAPHVPRDIVLVSESGIENADQARMLYKAGVSALLVGESLMRAKDPGKLIRELLSSS
ncbi:MAG TPA: indole-3-glycerol phosphate synthase TrpC [Chitinivibrionales bacterium]|jgi:indole-3-glycerol phosphate synthase|nr:indole-3-glycerol phosphate synthase TrpC [Chitinivibrionales bacterium]